jgi:hypothetical protein
MASSKAGMLGSYEFEQIGRDLFSKFQMRIYRTLSRFNFSDDIVYDGRYELFFSRCFVRGFSVHQTIDALNVAEESGLIDLNAYRKETF